MNNKTPKLGLNSFECPHCSVYTTQYWYRTLVSNYPEIANDAARYVHTFNQREQIEKTANETENDAKMKTVLNAHIDNLIRHKSGSKNILVYDFTHLYISECYNCQKVAIWRFEKMIFPKSAKIPKNQDMPDNVKSIYDEANDILDLSPRAATALIRLALQELLIFLGKKGNHLATDINQLINEGKISSVAQDALNIVRLAGNNAVHPREIDDSDNKDVAEKLFGLLNFIVDETITRPKQIETLKQGFSEKNKEPTNSGT